MLIKSLFFVLFFYTDTYMSSFQTAARCIISALCPIFAKKEDNRCHSAFFWGVIFYPNTHDVNPRPPFSVSWTAPGFKNCFPIWPNVPASKQPWILKKKGARIMLVQGSLWKANLLRFGNSAGAFEPAVAHLWPLYNLRVTSSLHGATMNYQIDPATVWFLINRIVG